MQRIPNSPPQIPSLADHVQRVRWSVMIPAYNCADFLPAAIESVLLQDPGADVMQIEVVDDCSTDADVEAIVLSIGKGRVGYYKQDQNVGSLRNFETCINRSKGQYIHLLHGDDKVKKGFYDTIESLFEQFPEAGAAFCGFDYINDSSEITRAFTLGGDEPYIIPNCLKRIACGQITQYVSTVVKRTVYESLGSFYAVTYGEDWIMWARIARDYPVAYTPMILAEYREHNTSISATGFLNGKNVNDLRTVAHLVSNCLPKKEQAKYRKLILRNFAYWLLDFFRTYSDTKIDNHNLHRLVKQILKGHTNFRLQLVLLKLRFLTWKDMYKNQLSS